MTEFLQFLTWASVILLGSGALAIFIWFLFDLRSILRELNAESPD